MTDKQPAAAHPFPCGHCRNPTPHTVCCCYFATHPASPALGDVEAAGKINLDLIAPEWAALYTAFARHREQAAAEERAKIVSYLTKVKGRACFAAARIEAKEHLK